MKPKRRGKPHFRGKEGDIVYAIMDFQARTASDRPIMMDAPASHFITRGTEGILSTPVACERGLWHVEFDDGNNGTIRVEAESAELSLTQM